MSSCFLKKKNTSGGSQETDSTWDRNLHTFYTVHLRERNLLRVTHTGKGNPNHARAKPNSKPPRLCWNLLIPDFFRSHVELTDLVVIMTTANKLRVRNKLDIRSYNLHPLEWKFPSAIYQGDSNMTLPLPWPLFHPFCLLSIIQITNLVRRQVFGDLMHPPLLIQSPATTEINSFPAIPADFTTKVILSWQIHWILLANLTGQFIFLALIGSVLPCPFPLNWNHRDW